MQAALSMSPAALSISKQASSSLMVALSFKRAACWHHMAQNARQVSFQTAVQELLSNFLIAVLVHLIGKVKCTGTAAKAVGNDILANAGGGGPLALPRSLHVMLWDWVRAFCRFEISWIACSLRCCLRLLSSSFSYLSREAGLPSSDTCQQHMSTPHMYVHGS